MCSLFGLAQVEVLDPTPAVAADVEARFGNGFGRRLVALQRKRTAEDGHRQATFLKCAHQPPEAGAAAVLEHPFAREVAASETHRGTRRFGKAGFSIAL